MISDVVDMTRHPIDDLANPAARALVDGCRQSLLARGVALVPGFVSSGALAETSDFVADEKESERTHLEDVHGTPYLELPDRDYPDGHPRRVLEHSLTWVIAYDQIPPDLPVRRLYESPAFLEFVAAVVDVHPLYRMVDPLGAMNLTAMDEGHVQGWHYDNADFVVSLAVQASEAGGEFECAPRIRDAGDENYAAVARVLSGEDRESLEVYPMTPGTLMIFAGRNSLHRVAAVQGGTSRQVALFAFDAEPGTDSSEVFKWVRYGRATTLSETP